MSNKKIYILYPLIIALFYCSCKFKSSEVNNMVIIEKNDNNCSKTVFVSLQEALDNKECVIILSLSKKEGYKKIPIEVFEEFPNLETLDLRFNELDSLPEKIEKLEKLKELILPYGTLRFIHPKIGILDSLKCLNLLHNRVRKLPKEICRLKNLKELNLTGNEIDSLPDCLCELKRLRILGLSYFPNSTHVDSMQFQHLKECLPNCRIYYHAIE